MAKILIIEIAIYEPTKKETGKQLQAMLSELLNDTVKENDKFFYELTVTELKPVKQS